MVNVPEQGLTTEAGGSLEDVVASLRTKNAGKQAALGALAYATAVKAGMGRLGDYMESFKHAHETGNIDEARALALAITQVTSRMSRAAMDLDAAVMREQDAQRAEGGVL